MGHKSGEEWDKRVVKSGTKKSGEEWDKRVVETETKGECRPGQKRRGD